MLRTRLFLNLIPFLVILTAVGLYAVILFSRMAMTVDESVMPNYRSVAAVNAMRLAAIRIETGLKLAAEGEKAAATSIFQQGTRAFEEGLAVQFQNVELPNEQLLTELMSTNYVQIRAFGEELLVANQRREEQRIHGAEIEPRLVKLQEQLEAIRVLNHESILGSSQRVADFNWHITKLMVLGMIVALVVSAYASYQLGKSILWPIQALTRATSEIGGGNLDLAVPVLSKDELGDLANAFNKMAAQLRAYRQSTSEKIVRLHRTMESTLSSFPDPIFVLDRERRIELKNPAAEELRAQLGLKDELPAGLQDAAADVLRTGMDFMPHSFEEVIAFRVRGAERFFLPRILVMHGDELATVGVAVVLYDVTRFRLLDDAKTNLVATVSHELKTPLTSVRMVLHLLLEKSLGPLTTKQDELLQTARTDAERLLRILNDLLDLARLETGNSGLNRERVPPDELLRNIADEMQTAVEQQGFKLAATADPQLPRVEVDRQRIAHVFRNFIANAMKHSPPGGVIEIRAAHSDNGSVQFSVADQGPGVPEEYQGRIFDRFFRVPGQRKTGAGLGLSIAREIVIAHGGIIGVRNRPGRGGEFYFVLDSAEEADRKLG